MVKLSSMSRSARQRRSYSVFGHRSAIAEGKWNEIVWHGEFLAWTCVGPFSPRDGRDDAGGLVTLVERLTTHGVV